MISIPQIIELLRSKIAEQLQIKADDFTLNGLKQIKRPNDREMFYPSEYPVPQLLSLLLKPENRDILLQFIMRYHRDEIMREAFSALIAEHQEWLFRHFAEVSDFPLYISSLSQDPLVSEFIMQFDLHSELQSGSSRQKNYDSFVGLTEALRVFTAEMTQPEFHAICDLYAQKKIKRADMLSMLDAMSCEPSKIVSDNLPRNQKNLILARFNEYNQVLTGMLNNCVKYYEETAMNLLSVTSYDQALSKTQDKEMRELLNFNEMALRVFYLPASLHQDRIKLINCMAQSLRECEVCPLFEILRKTYLLQYQNNKYDLPRLVTEAGSFSQALQAVQNAPKDTIVKLTQINLMINVLKRHEGTFHLFFSASNQEEKAEILINLEDQVNRHAAAFLPEQQHCVQWFKRAFLQRRYEHESVERLQGVANHSPVNNRSPII